VVNVSCQACDLLAGYGERTFKLRILSMLLPELLIFGPILRLNGLVPEGIDWVNICVTVGKLVRINKQLCWACRRVAGQGGD